ncbi:putative bifunctional diguanylate cyclase/phosphodiesterase [Romboutsia lituseburensis]|uniref:putative bifunctional diguanylate cyclase/phosphodiesterase n=1 Tax=Romboutsia lituseburensis TaxID=1537 RepID=UPI00215AD2D8|nr:bifunctional diguanylate cyclase/phosphodiesterase [Romboutsia lituseburensis]MCR8745412.1 bifunctional diguanylate cyclase/phosphodiesterase [Romboutsia lituseburensis]
MEKFNNMLKNNTLCITTFLVMTIVLLGNLFFLIHTKGIIKNAKYKDSIDIKSINVELNKNIGKLPKESKKYIGIIKMQNETENICDLSFIFLDKEDINRVVICIIVILISMILLIYLIIKKIKKYNCKQIKSAISKDALTELINYDKFIVEAKYYLQNRKSSNCIMVSFDIDKFKLINDVYGYKTGDEILKCISKNLKLYFGDRIVYGRLTGDVFGILMELYNKEKKVPYIAQAITNKIGNISSSDLDINIDLSIGIYDIQKEFNIKKIIDNADMARLKSKEYRYQNYAIFDEKLSQEKKKLMQLEQDLFYSIKNNELILHYQPKFNINDEKIVGSEALIRWQHPTIGMISPMTFIPIAEKTRFINNIGKWVFEEVCSKIKDWTEEGINVVPVAINLSRVELYQQDLVENLKLILAKYKVNPKLIEIEITETTALNDIEFINKKLTEIKSLGIKVAMDDFGTGNSNLSNLKDIPIDVLKLDRSLLLDIENNEKTEVMVKSILSLSKNLSLSTVCEGVENRNQVEVLKSTGCEVVQGYVFSKPVEIHEYKELLK